MLRPEDFEVEGPTPYVRLDGSRTKNGQLAEQPLPINLAAELRPWLSSKAPGEPLFALPEKTALMLHADLRLCGIEPVDDQGRVVDTHSLRHGYISALARAGVPIKVAQTLARHSDPKLTMNVYSHLTAFDLHGAIADALPDLTSEADENFVVATGTHGPTATQNATLPEESDPNVKPANEFTSIHPMTLNQRVVGSSPTGGTSARGRQGTSTPRAYINSRTLIDRSSKQATEDDTVRPLRTTCGATPLLPDDPDLAAIVAAWPDLPEAIRAGIGAMVKAAWPKR